MSFTPFKLIFYIWQKCQIVSCYSIVQRHYKQMVRYVRKVVYVILVSFQEITAAINECCMHDAFSKEDKTAVE